MTRDEVQPGRTTTLKGSIPGEYLTPPPTGELDDSLPWVIELRVKGTATTIQMQLRESMLLGRDDPEHDFHPEIDLTTVEGFMAGVSRKHAVILAHEGRVSVKDLNSTNGTKLNGFQLVAGMEYKLEHGDELALGDLAFQVQFAVVPSREQPKAAPPMASSLLRAAGLKRHILVIEDDVDVSTVYRMGLEKVGYQVTLAGDGTTALDAVTNITPDLIVMDLMLPDLNGLDLIQYVRRHEQGTHVPVIVVSAASGGFQSGKALEAGADMFLSKPLMLDDLIKAVREVLARPASADSPLNPLTPAAPFVPPTMD